MTQEEKDNLSKKWATLMDNDSSTESNTWLCNNPIPNDIIDNNTFPSLLPIAKQVFAKTCGLDLVTVKPMSSPSWVENERISQEVKSENRDRKIDSIVEDKDFEEMKMKDHPDYRGPSIGLMYLDFQYNSVYNSTYSFSHGTASK